MNMIPCNNEKEHIVNVIKELKQQIILIENKLDELRIFYITNKDIIIDCKLVKTFFDNLIDADYEIGVDKMDNTFLKNSVFFSNENYQQFINEYSGCYSDLYRVNSSTIFSPTYLADALVRGKNGFKKFCNEEETKLFFIMFFLEKKLKYYENRLTRLYPEKPEIKNIMDMYVEQNVLVEY